MHPGRNLGFNYLLYQTAILQDQRCLNPRACAIRGRRLLVSLHASVLGALSQSTIGRDFGHKPTAERYSGVAGVCRVSMTRYSMVNGTPPCLLAVMPNNVGTDDLTASERRRDLRLSEDHFFLFVQDPR